MAKVIATIGGVALAPGVSKNRRLYTPEHIASAVTRAQKRIESGDRPMVMLTHHAAGDDSRQIAASLTSVRVDEDGRARYTAAITDTAAGRDIASLVDTSDGKPPHLDGVSIRGYWLGTVRKVKGPDGQPVETADDLDWDGLDFTRTPGVDAANVDTFAWAKRAGQHETTERVAICESVQEARVTITEEAVPDLPALSEADRESLAALLPPRLHILENGLCVTCEEIGEAETPAMSKRGSGTSGSGRVWADPGYQADKKQRYDITDKDHAVTAWKFINQKAKASKYTGTQLKRIKARIIGALKKFGVSVAAESADWPHGLTFAAPIQVSEALAEHLGMSSCAGSWSVRASNGPVDICLSSYSVDPEDLDVILRAAADAACKALAALDPDMDGDVDLPGAGSASDPDGDAPGESAPGEAPPTDPAASEAAATTETEDPAMGETTNPAESAAPAIDQAALAEAVTKALEASEAARRARKAAKREAAEKAAADAARIAQESAALGTGTPATAGATATETEDVRRARLAALVEQQFAAKAASEGLVTEKTDEQIIAEMIEERLVPLRQARAEGGGVQRKGIATLEALAGSPQIGKQLQDATNEDLKYAAGAAYGPKGSRA